MKSNQQILPSRNTNDNPNHTSTKLKWKLKCYECPFCHEKNLKQFEIVGEGNIKCMSCCNYCG